MQKRDKLIQLYVSPPMTRPLLRNILRHDPDLSHIHHIPPAQLSTIFHITEKRARSIRETLNDTNIRKKVEYYQKHCRIMTIFDNDFPPLLKLIPDPPLVLFLKGKPELLHHSPLLSVVGTRTPSKDAFPSMQAILSPLLQKGLTVVSGMAKGIDQYAHRLAVDQKGHTIAVLGSGFKHIYPKNDLPLYEELCQNHLVISEHSPDVAPKKYHFPERNRIISGLSPSLLVVEARVKSGTLITVDQALEQGREVYAMPGKAGSVTSEGCHKMIQEGALLVHSAQDLLDIPELK